MYMDRGPFGALPTCSSDESVASLIIWIREQPLKHCRIAGELDSVLWYLHLVWARLADKESNFQTALEEVGLKPQGLLTAEEQKNTVNSDDEATKTVLRFWAIVGSILGIEKKTQAWPKSMTAIQRGQQGEF